MAASGGGQDAGVSGSAKGRVDDQDADEADERRRARGAGDRARRSTSGANTSAQSGAVNSSAKAWASGINGRA